MPTTEVQLKQSVGVVESEIKPVGIWDGELRNGVLPGIEKKCVENGMAISREWQNGKVRKVNL